jgi:hypothetical protein
MTIVASNIEHIKFLFAHPDLRRFLFLAKRDRFIHQFGAEDGELWAAEGIGFDEGRERKLQAEYGSAARLSHHRDRPAQPYVPSQAFLEELQRFICESELVDDAESGDECKPTE